MAAREDNRQLKGWLIQNLEAISEADPLLLCDYILALLKQESTSSELAKVCEQKLEEFLGQHTAPFVAKMIRFLDTTPIPSTSAPSASDTRGLKRSFDPDPLSFPESKLSRQSAMPRPPTGPAAMRIAAGPMQGLPINGPLSYPMGMMPRGWGPARAEPLQKVAEPCKDYHYKGFCARGDSCQYLHDDLSTLPLALHPSRVGFPGAPPPSHFPGNTSTYSAAPPIPSTSRDAGIPPSSGPHHRPPPSSMPQDPRRSIDTLVVENIPRESLSIESVRKYFQTFGTLTNITVDPRASRAIISYANAEQAKVALASPEAIFGNRFVKVFRQRMDFLDGSIPNGSFANSGPPHSPQAPLPPRPSPSLPLPRPPSTNSHTFSRPQIQPRSAPLHYTGSHSLVNTPAAKPQVTPPAPVSAALQARLDLLQANTVRQKELLDQLEAPALETAERKEILKELRALGKVAAEGVGSVSLEFVIPKAELDSIAQLAQLRKEAAALGINVSTPPFSDRGRGRGRGSTRGRGMRGAPRPLAAPRTFRLDNRTTTLSTEVLSDASLLPGLLSYLQPSPPQQFGTVTQSTQDDKLVFKFETRAEAELALSKGSTIPDVGVVPFQWHHSSTPSGESSVAGTNGIASPELGTPPQIKSEEESMSSRFREEPERILAMQDEDELERSWNR